jgi:hypothetical protein
MKGWFVILEVMNSGVLTALYTETRSLPFTIPDGLNSDVLTPSCTNVPLSVHVYAALAGDRIRTSVGAQSMLHVLPTVTLLHPVVLRPMSLLLMVGHAHAGSCI